MANLGNVGPGADRNAAQLGWRASLAFHFERIDPALFTFLGGVLSGACVNVYTAVRLEDAPKQTDPGAVASSLLFLASSVLAILLGQRYAADKEEVDKYPSLTTVRAKREKYLEEIAEHIVTYVVLAISMVVVAVLALVVLGTAPTLSQSPAPLSAPTQTATMTSTSTPSLTPSTIPSSTLTPIPPASPMAAPL